MSLSAAKVSVRSAVGSGHLLSRRGLLERIFAIWFDGFFYNQIWEDPNIDIAALRIDSDSRILTIASGGCNALNYLLESPKSVTAVDLNLNHLRLLELKKAAALYLPDFESFFEFFGFGKGQNTESNYHRYIAPHFDRQARDYWESNSLIGSVTTGPRLAFFRDRGLYQHSRSAVALRFFHWLANFHSLHPAKILAASSLDAQQRIFEEEIAPFFDLAIVRLIGRLSMTLFGLGIPPKQFEELANGSKRNASLIDVYRNRIRRFACEFPISENYFAWQAFGRRYDTQRRKALPAYLKRENFVRLRSNAPTLALIHCPVTQVIAETPKGTFNRFVFLDAQDWMDNDAINHLWTLIRDRGEPGSRIVFRTAGELSPIESRLDPEIRQSFQYEAEESSRLARLDKTAIYGGFHLYVLKKK
ncbi:MAG: DUF3419 domain-containing protein [Blastocatellia bacterium]